MVELGIEKALKLTGRKLGMPLSEKYVVLKNRLFTKEYGFWGQKFPGGNDHGPSHIERVLENLDRLLGPKPLTTINGYELFLAMMGILYHDVGILHQRAGHADTSEKFLHEESNEYIFDEHDRDIIGAAVVSHSHSKDIADECQRFAEEEPVNGQTVRPRVIAALVRFADELDEDYRRADPLVEERLEIPEASKFFWQFSQRIEGIRPRFPIKEITITVKFKNEDVGRTIQWGEVQKSFLYLFADKLAKINQERVTVNQFLPDSLRYRSIIVQVRPLDNHPRWKKSRSFEFTDQTFAAEFVSFYPELLVDPSLERMEKVLESIRLARLDEADEGLRWLENITTELPATIRLRVFYVGACLDCRHAELMQSDNPARKEALDRAELGIKEWLQLGNNGAFRESGTTVRNEIWKMGKDEDLSCLFRERLDATLEILGKELQSALPSSWLPLRSASAKGGGTRESPKPLPINRGGGGAGGGCVPAGTMIQTPDGEVAIEDLQEGSQILSVDLNERSGIIVTRVVQIHNFLESECIRLNHKYTVTPKQPLYEIERGWTRAADLTQSMQVLDKRLCPQQITHIERLRAAFRVYTLTTDHPSHNYLAYGLICANKKQL